MILYNLNFSFLFSLFGLILGVTCTILVLLLFIYGHSKLHRVWILFNISVAIWGYGAFFIGKATNLHQGIVVWRLAFVGVIFISVFFYHIACLFCKVDRSRIIQFAYLQGFFFLILNATNFYISEVFFFRDSFYYLRAKGLFFSVSFAIWFLLVMAGLLELVVHFNKFTETRRMQALYLFVGFGVGFLGGTTNFFPMFGIPILPFGNITIPLYCIIVTYAILRYRLLDISIAITRTGIFVAVYTIVLGIPFAIAFGLKEQLKMVVGENWWLVPLVSMTVLATAGPFIYLYIQGRTEERLLREQRDYQDSLRRSSQGMVNIKNLGRLLKLIVGTILRAVKIEHCSIYLFHEDSNNFVLKVAKGKHVSSNKTIIQLESDLVKSLRRDREPIVVDEIKQKNQYEKSSGLTGLQKQLDELNAELVVPSFNEEKMIAILVMGKKNSDKAYTQDDISVFSILSNQAALAIENAQFYVKMKETHQQLFKAEKMATIGTMADGLSHQINNRLHSMGFIAGDALDTVRIKLKTDISADMRELLLEMEHALKRIEENVKRGGEVVGGLLRYTRKADEGFTPVNLNEVIDSALEMAQFKIKLDKITFLKKFDQSILPPIKANFTQLQEVFFNVIDNSYDAIMQRQSEAKEQGYKGVLEVSAEVIGYDIKIHVCDNGMGVKKEDLQKLFTPFFTTKATSKKGTGLGLYVIRQIIEEYHTGKVEFYSIHNKGSETIITLPVYDVQPVEENSKLSLSS